MGERQPDKRFIRELRGVSYEHLAAKFEPLERDGFYCLINDIVRFWTVGRGMYELLGSDKQVAQIEKYLAARLERHFASEADAAAFAATWQPSVSRETD